MSGAADLTIKRSETATTQLIVKTVLSVIMTVALIGYAMTAADPRLGMVAWVASFASLLLLGVRVMTLVKGRVPLQVTVDTVTISSSAKISVPRSKITGAGLHPKTGLPCLFFNDPEKGHSGPLTLPLRFIDTEHHTLLGQLVDLFGRAPESPGDAD